MLKRFFISLFTFALILTLMALALLRPVRTEADKLCFSALGQLGAAYEYAVCEPGRAFDCSSFTSYIYGLYGINLPRDARATGYLKSGVRIEDMHDLRRGDVVCFDTEPTDGDLSDHTGLYLGQGYFIHSSSGAGKVIVSSLTSGYYKDNFSWGRRTLN